MNKHKNDFSNAHQLLSNVKEGKEYYFTCGSHAAIVRKGANGFEYLELQSRKYNGFHPLTDEALKIDLGRKNHIRHLESNMSKRNV